MSAPFNGSVPADTARIIFDCTEPLGAPVPCAPQSASDESEHCLTDPDLHFDSSCAVDETNLDGNITWDEAIANTDGVGFFVFVCDRVGGVGGAASLNLMVASA
ncbi:hypothetical protein AK812_SmicGene13126 [Symbiodinium microadriaticum]|uniref:Uncharacterized protein n=1 Tax=Symbiodinium microadriaticum TaxID=2951 RepID=A0A1Q9E8Y6_SYMMI|nr:hypothetical protein AK812_SmicGene13126 [Symbiodinium microadriaticum]